MYLYKQEAVGPLDGATAVNAARALPRDMTHREGKATTRLKIGVIGFGKFGQFISGKFAANHDVVAMGRGDYSNAAREIGMYTYVYGCGYSKCYFIYIQ